MSTIDKYSEISRLTAKASAAGVSIRFCNQLVRTTPNGAPQQVWVVKARNGRSWSDIGLASLDELLTRLDGEITDKAVTVQVGQRVRYGIRERVSWKDYEVIWHDGGIVDSIAIDRETGEIKAFVKTSDKPAKFLRVEPSLLEAVE